MPDEIELERCECGWDFKKGEECKNPKHDEITDEMWQQLKDIVRNV